MYCFQNLFFAFALELRAIAKVAPYLRAENFYTGNAEEDAATRSLIDDVLSQVQGFDNHFDETQMFQGPPALARELKEEFRSHFWNISRIMDCVGCDKCRLWGKVNIHGLATALKILFSNIPVPPPSSYQYSSHSGGRNSVTPFQLRREDIVALFHSIGRFASSIEEISKFRKLFAAEDEKLHHKGTTTGG